MARNSGFTLLELMIVIAIIGILAAIALPFYTSYRDRAKITVAIQDIINIEQSITAFQINNNKLPDTLSDTGYGSLIDPYGNAYIYAPFTSIPPGKRRKDKSLVPVNTDYDLYSMGADGDSVAPFTAKASQDDIVRAGDGAFVGLAKDY